MWVNCVDAVVGATLILALVLALIQVLVLTLVHFAVLGPVDIPQCIAHATISDSTGRLPVAIAQRPATLYTYIDHIESRL